MAKTSRTSTIIRDNVKSLSTLTGVDPKVVENILVAQELLIQYQIYQQYKNNPEEIPEIYLPYLGNLKMFPIKYKNRDDVPNNAATRINFYPDDKFKRRVRRSMYQERNYLIDHTLENFKDHFVQKFKSLI